LNYQVVHASCRLADGLLVEDPLARAEAVLPEHALLYSLSFTQIVPVGRQLISTITNI
jgi:hypothetical protein